LLYTRNQQPYAQPPAQPPAGTNIVEPATGTQNIPLYSKQAATVTKIYTDDQKYNRLTASFDFKLTIFYNVYKRAGLPPEGYMTAFPTMLKGLAHDYYYNSNLLTRPFNEVYNHI
jgi:hypothetical protein